MKMGYYAMKIPILDVNIDSVTMEEAVERALALEGNGHMIFTPNPEIIMAAQEDAALMEALNTADMLLPDGIGVVIASKILDTPLPERVPGFDFACRLLESGRSFYLFGAKPGVAEEAARRLREKDPEINIVGTHHGYFDDDSDIIKDINEKKPDVLLVCLGAPKQERWIASRRTELEAKLMLGVGGTLDVLAGVVKRAPVFWQKVHLEWLYRALKEPSRFPRLMVLPRFVWRVIFSKRRKKA